MPEKKAYEIHGLIDFPRREAVLLMEMGYLYMQMGKFEGAFDIFNGVAHLMPHSDVPCVALSNLYVAQKKFAPAQKQLENALKRVPESALAYAHLGELCFFQKKFDEGIAALEKAIEIEPRSDSAKFARELLRAHDLKIFGAND